VLSNIVEKLAARGIYTILDCHQDLLSPKFCGEGAPDFAVQVGAKSLPFPLPEMLQPIPIGVRLIIINNDMVQILTLDTQI